MAELNARDAYAALLDFAQNLVNRLVALGPVFERVAQSEALLVTLQPQIDQKTAELADARTALKQAQNDRQTLLDGIEHDREVKQADADRQLAAYWMDLHAQLAALRETVAAERTTLRPAEDEFAQANPPVDEEPRS